MKRTRKLFKLLRGKRAIVLVAAVLVASLITALPGMAQPRGTMLQTKATTVDAGNGLITVNAKVTNVGQMPALPGIKVALISRDKGGSETVIEEFNKNGALPSGKSFAKSFTVNAANPAELIVTAQARNSTLSVSEVIPVPISPIILIGLVLTLGLLVWNQKNRLQTKSLIASKIYA